MAAKGTQDGLPIDASGNPAIDPTANVIALNEAAARRQDDLRAASEKFLLAGLDHLKEMGDLRERHAKEIRELDTKRLEATRAVDINAGQTEAKRALDALQTLATQTQINAENLRTALANTATTIAQSTADTVSGIFARLAALEKSSYEGAGKDAGPSAQIRELTAAVTLLVAKDSNREGKGQGMGALWGYILGAVGIALALYTSVLDRVN